MSSTGTFSVNLSGLASDTTYYFRAKATGSITVYGSELSFSTLKELVSIDIAPNNLTIALGRTQLFNATGTYSDNSTANLTTTVTWTSDNTSVATIGANTGLTTTVAAGTTTITATYVGTTGNTTLTVLPDTVPSAPAPPVGGGGGGGGGGGLPGVTPVYGVITDKGKFTEDVTCKSEDKKVELFIPEGTIGKNRVGSLLTSISIKEMAEPTTPPEQTDVIGLVYDIGPDRATFDPPIDLTIKYDESAIPGGVAEKSLFVATFDSSTDQWVELESTIEPENDAVTAKVSHFTAFTVLAHTSPASFTVTDLSLTPDEVDLGESISISVFITNTGDLAGSYEVSVKIDNVVAQTKEVTLDGGDSETISLSVTLDTVGEHTVNISGLLETFKVKLPKAPPAPAPAPAVAPAPASFAISDLSITPSEVKPAEQVTISTVVTNTGGSEGSYTVVLKINGAEEIKKEVTLGAGKSETVIFTIAKDTEGSYTVNINGKVGQFTAITSTTKAPTRQAPSQTAIIEWWLLSVIIAVILASGLVSYFIVRLLRETKE